jgi:hypothetical protein
MPATPLRLPLLTVTYPQFPLSKTIDTHYAEDDILDDEDTDDEDEGGRDDDDYDRMAQSPSPPHHPTMPHALGRYSIPSPESYPQARRGPSHGGIAQSPSSPLRYSAPSPESYRGSSSSHADQGPIPPCKKCSTCIPDFVQLVYKLAVKPDHKIDRPVLIQNRIVLLVENKADMVDPTLVDFNCITRQTDQQARRAFVLFPNVDTLGVILAIGPYWTYIEYDSANARPSPSKSEQNDPTYMDRTPSPANTPGRFYEPVLELFKPDGFARLETEKSAKGLRLVQQRMKVLAGV